MRDVDDGHSTGLHMGNASSEVNLVRCNSRLHHLPDSSLLRSRICLLCCHTHTRPSRASFPHTYTARADKLPSTSLIAPTPRKRGRWWRVSTPPRTSVSTPEPTRKSTSRSNRARLRQGLWQSCCLVSDTSHRPWASRPWQTASRI
jgi:hypothetical protein